jgi:hypothetical protein
MKKRLNPSMRKSVVKTIGGGTISKKAIQSLRDKFKKRDQSTLDTIYAERDQRTKSSSMAKTVFNSELMEKYGITNFSTTLGDRFIEIMPLSFDVKEPYYKQISVHFGVGLQNDAYVCMARYQTGKRCYRCEVQQTMWRDQQTYTKDETKLLYPTDRACYLLWDRTKELIDNESPDYTLQLWAAPKGKVHAEIQAKVRDRISGHTIDISDLSTDEDSEGRTVGFTIVKKGEWPDYKAFDLIQRDKPIPNEIVNKLAKIIEDANELGYPNAIEMFINFPEYDEIRESMQTETPVKETSKTGPVASLRQSFRENYAPSEEEVLTEEQEKQNFKEFEKNLMEELEELQGELESICQNKIKWRKWCKDNDYEMALELDIVEAVPAIIDDIYEKEMAKAMGNDH